MGQRSATPTSYYFSGQGRLAVADRDPATGVTGSFRYLGNVTELTIAIANTKKEHKESMTGNRGIDNTLIQELKPTIAFKTESLSLENLAAGVYGTTSKDVGGPVTGEVHKFTALGTFIPLNNPNVSAVTVTVGDDATAQATACVLGTDYTIDTDFGVVYPIATSSVITAGKFVKVAYTYVGVSRVDSLCVATPPEKTFRFEGLNTVNGDMQLIELYRAKLEPIASIPLINDDFAAIDFTGNLLLDPFRPVTSQYWSQKIWTPSAA